MNPITSMRSVFPNRSIRPLRRIHFSSSSTNNNIISSGTGALNVDPNSPKNEAPCHLTKTTIWSSLSNERCIDYSRGWAWQQVLMCHRLHKKRQRKEQQQMPAEEDANNEQEDDDDDDDDCILLLEHAPVYTLGRGASEDHLTFLGATDDDDNNSNTNSNDNNYRNSVREKLSRKYRGKDSARLSMDRRSLEEEILNYPSVQEAVDGVASAATPVLAPNGVPIYRVDRGGEVTFHGPSQLVVYPIIDLKREPFQPDLHWYLRMVEEVVIQTLRQYDIDSVRDDINTGVWVGHNKIAAVGVSASRWISSHGFALNVCPDLEYFDTSVILPCGIEGRGVTSIKEVLKARGESTHPSVEEVAQVALQSIQDVFGIEIEGVRNNIT